MGSIIASDLVKLERARQRFYRLRHQLGAPGAYHEYFAIRSWCVANCKSDWGFILGFDSPPSGLATHFVLYFTDQREAAMARICHDLTVV